METNTHWNEWRIAVQRTGHTSQLALASKRLQELDELTAVQIENLFREYAARQN